MTTDTGRDEPRLQPNGHYAVNHLGHPYQPAGNFGFAAHDKWVQAGHCPVVALSKAWCSSRPGHALRHTSPYIPGPGQAQVTKSWDR